ncbi:hypothetical protein C2S51_034463 [Perilla frutescens var. frutescens]|nr:hypothetical protein C2S51_034463 [Perilla frutescens var. frutescens]
MDGDFGAGSMRERRRVAKKRRRSGVKISLRIFNKRRYRNYPSPRHARRHLAAPGRYDNRAISAGGNLIGIYIWLNLPVNSIETLQICGMVYFQDTSVSEKQNSVIADDDKQPAKRKIDL